MKKIFRLLFWVISINSAICVCGQEREMPIIAFWGVPEGKTMDVAFQRFKECGFTVSLYPYKSLEALIRACRCADKYGVKIIGSCPELVKTPTKAVHALKKENGFFGYQIQDEPRTIKKKMTVLLETKNNIPCHITKKLQEEKLQKSYRVSAGDILLVRLE